MEKFSLVINNITNKCVFVSSVDTGNNFMVPVGMYNEIKENCSSDEQALGLIISLREKIINYDNTLDSFSEDSLNIGYNQVNDVLTRLFETGEYSSDVVELALDKLTDGAVGVIVEKQKNSELSLVDSLHAIIVKIIHDEYDGISTIEDMFLANSRQYAIGTRY